MFFKIDDFYIFYIFIGKGSCYWTDTKTNLVVNGLTTNLIGIKLSCREGYGITYFRYIRETDGIEKFGYKYQCCTSQLPCTKRNVVNPQSQYGWGSPHYLDRQHVNCEKGIISGFQLIINDPNMTYAYDCCQGKKPVTCFTKYTSYEDNGGYDGYVQYLDRQQVACESKYLLSAFQLDRLGDKWRYRYSCCNTQF